jgi:hypothetical protein
LRGAIALTAPAGHTETPAQRDSGVRDEPQLRFVFDPLGDHRDPASSRRLGQSRTTFASKPLTGALRTREASILM